MITKILSEAAVKDPIGLHVIGKFDDGIKFHGHEMPQTKDGKVFHLYTDFGHDSTVCMSSAHNPADITRGFAKIGSKINLHEATSAPTKDYHKLSTVANLIKEYGVGGTHSDQLENIKAQISDLRNKIPANDIPLLDEHSKYAAKATKLHLDRRSYGLVDRINSISSPKDVHVATAGDHSNGPEDSLSDIILSFHPGEHPTRLDGAHVKRHIGVELSDTDTTPNAISKNDLHSTFPHEYSSDDGEFPSTSVRNSVFDSIQSKLNSGPAGHTATKAFILNHMLPTSNMPKVKTVVHGEKRGDTVSCCSNHTPNSRLIKMCKDKKTKVSAHKNDVTGSYSGVNFKLHHPSHSNSVSAGRIDFPDGDSGGSPIANMSSQLRESTTIIKIVGLDEQVEIAKKIAKSLKKSAGISKEGEDKFHSKLDSLVHDTFGKRTDEK